MNATTDRLELSTEFNTAREVEVESVDEITREALVRIDGTLYTAYGERNLRGGYTYRVF